MTRTIFPPLLLLATAAVAGCASLTSASYPVAAEARLEAYARASVCCDDPASFRFQPLPERGTAEALIGSSSPAYDFHSGVSPFAAFELPAAAAPYRVRVKSLIDDTRDAYGAVFYPVVAVLDETFIVVRLSGVDNLRLEPDLATPGSQVGLAVTVPIDPAGRLERYLVVFTPAAMLGAAPGSRREGDVLTMTTQAWLSRNAEAMVAASPYGRLQITVAPELLPAGPRPN